MPRPHPIRTWLQLFRAPNLLTVPGDPLAGYLLASFGSVDDKLSLAIGASLSFYAGGLLLNDLADLREDRRERPTRPLPSGAASVPAVAAVLTLLFALGLWLCWRIDRVTFATGGALLVAIVSYNCSLKRFPGVGALNMGLCRGLSMMLGVTAVPHGDLTYRLLQAGRLSHVLIPVLITTAFIAAVTNLARFETHTLIPRLAKWLPVTTLVIGGFIFLRRLEESGLISSTPLFIIAAACALQVALRLERDAATPVPAEIGKLIRLILLLQASYCASVAALGACFGNTVGYASTVVLLALWPLSRLLSRLFYAS
jgi:4-hydroxybenzoate polyprenyltransferase